MNKPFTARGQRAGHGLNPSARRFATAIVLAGVAVGSVVTSATGAHAATISARARTSGGGCDTVHAGPLRVGAGTGSYFTLRTDAGRDLIRHVVIANPSRHTCRVNLTAAYGKTATNSGDSYVPVEAGLCLGPSCWLSDLPTTLTVAPETRRVFTFGIHVPAGTAAGEYLAGIQAEPVVTASSAARSTAGVSARVVTRVAIGVAVVVSGPLAPHLTIPTVTVDTKASVMGAAIDVVESDNGNTWEHPAGTITVSGIKKPVTLPVVSNTILPNGSATLQVPTQGIPSGAHPSRVELWYDGHKKVAIWEGTLVFPSPPKVTTTNGVTTVVVAPATTPHTGVPTWLVVTVLVLGGGLLLLLLVLLLLLWRRRRRDNDDHPRVVIQGLPGSSLPPSSALPTSTLPTSTLPQQAAGGHDELVAEAARLGSDGE